MEGEDAERKERRGNVQRSGHRRGEDGMRIVNRGG
jgi:hypothetical protein